MRGVVEVSLPDGDMPWPPPGTERPRRYYEEWGAWYSGCPEALERVYSGRGMARVRPSQLSGGVVGRLARWFWGNPPRNQASSRLHVPLAADIAAASADLLFGEAPVFEIEDDRTRARLDALMTEGGLSATLLEAAEACAAYGGVFLRVGWDLGAGKYPLVDVIEPDCAAPEWQGRQLRAVTFWRVLDDSDANRVVRHLERHEPGRVYHGVYQGTVDRLGRPVPLADYEEVAYLADYVDASGGLDTGTSHLAVVYVPNMRPHRLIRGTPLGRSDFAGVEPLLDALDEAWSSWMWDLRVARARLFVADSLLRSSGPGQGAWFDFDADLIAPLAGLQAAGERWSDMLFAQQFAIRVEEHSRTCQELTEQIIRGAGYSAQTFGESRDLAITATEVQARERRTYSTRDRKVSYWRSGLARLATVLLEVDRHVFGSPVTVETPRVVWPDGVQESMLTLAQTVRELDTARAASTETRVRLLHPDWDDAQVAAEVAKIQAELPEKMEPRPGQGTPRRRSESAV